MTHAGRSWSAGRAKRGRQACRVRWRTDRIFRCLDDLGCYLTWVVQPRGPDRMGRRGVRGRVRHVPLWAMTPGTCVSRWADLGSCIVGEPGRPAAEGGQDAGSQL